MPRSPPAHGTGDVIGPGRIGIGQVPDGASFLSRRPFDEGGDAGEGEVVSLEIVHRESRRCCPEERECLDTTGHRAGRGDSVRVITGECRMLVDDEHGRDQVQR